MNIGLLAHNSKKSLMEDFCLAYKKILEKHELYATGTTGRRIEEVTKLHVHKFLPGSIGGEKQFVEMIARNEMDMVIFFYNPLLNSPKEPSIDAICRACDTSQYSHSDQYSYGGISDPWSGKRRSGMERTSMTINDFENLFMFAGGLGMFLFGVHSMSGGVQKCAGEQMRKLLGILTNNRFVGVLVGARSLP